MPGGLANHRTPTCPHQLGVHRLEAAQGAGVRPNGRFKDERCALIRVHRLDGEALAKLGVAETVIPRTLQALVWLGLVNQAGTLTESMLQLRRARSEDYAQLLEDLIRTRCADVFQFWSPGDDPGKLEDVFRHYTQ